MFSLLCHALLLKVTFSGQGWLPGFSFPWRDRRVEVPDLRVALLPARVDAPQPAAAPVPEEAPAPVPTPVVRRERTSRPAEVPDVLEPERLRESTPAPIVEPPLITTAQPDKTTWVVPPSAEIPQPLDPSEARARRQEEALSAPVSLDAERGEVARGEVARREAVARAIGKPLDEGGSRQRADIALSEIPRVEAPRPEPARVGPARVEPPIEPPRIEPAKVEPAPDPAAEAAARREAVLKRLGRQLDEEAQRRDAMAAAARDSPTYTGPRRYRLFGRADSNAVLVRYAEDWSRKIEMNMTLDIAREASKVPHDDPLVTVAVRADGSVESVTIVRSSGIPAIDAAVRRVVESQAPFQVFPPSLAAAYDVIEIRRTWHFDVAIRLD